MISVLNPAAAPDNDTPTFAVVGAVNHGKSSVVATLAENDQVRISRMPGETVENQRFALRSASLGSLFTFHDTPGFQNAREALAQLRDAASDAQPLQRFAAFIERHRGDPAFAAECRLFEPVVRGAGIVYVVDAARPLRELHSAEMELMRLTGAPRLAIINRTMPASGEHASVDHLLDWKLRLGQHFNAVREFDAHQACFADRIELLETLAGIEQRWKPRLMQAVQVLRADREQRLDEAARITADWLAHALSYREEQRTADEAEADILARFKATLARDETAAHAALIALFSHHHVQPATDAQGLFADDLFSDATWQLLGLDARQLLGAGTAAGAAVGASTDLLTAGHTLMLGSVLGAALGAAGAFALGKRQPELAVRNPLGLPSDVLPGPLQNLVPERWRASAHLAGRVRGVGPYAALNFPWILIDRAIGTLACVAQRAHARRDIERLDALRLHELLAAQHLASTAWPAEDRRVAERAMAAVRRTRPTPADEAQLGELRNALRRWMSRLDHERSVGHPGSVAPAPTIPP